MNSNNIHKSLTTVLHNERVNDHYQQQEHRSRYFGRSNSLLLLSLLLKLVAAGSGFLFVSLLPTGRIINNSSNNYNYNNSKNHNNNGENFPLPLPYMNISCSPKIPIESCQEKVLVQRKLSTAVSVPTTTIRQKIQTTTQCQNVD